MAIDYNEMRDTAESLLEEFGSTCILKHDTEEIEFDPETMRDTKVYDEYEGTGVKLNYNSEAIGGTNTIIQAGDVKVLCLFPVEPVEDRDKIILNGISYNIIECGKVEPNSETTVLYVLQCRKAS